MVGKVSWSFLEVQTFRKCKIVWKVPFLFVGFFFPGVITGASCNHRELRLVHVSLAWEGIPGLLKRTKDRDLNTVSRGWKMPGMPSEVDTGISSHQG